MILDIITIFALLIKCENNENYHITTKHRMG